MEDERRRRSRVPVSLEVMLTLDDEEITVSTDNISLKGMLLKAPRQLPVEKLCYVTLTLTPEMQAVVMGRIVRSTPEETAIDFVQMDVESFKHLKKIVEYHASDPEKICREILHPAF